MFCDSQAADNLQGCSQSNKTLCKTHQGTLAAGYALQDDEARGLVRSHSAVLRVSAQVEEQVKLLQKGVTHIGVGTPGRISALIEKGRTRVFLLLDLEVFEVLLTPLTLVQRV